MLDLSVKQVFRGNGCFKVDFQSLLLQAATYTLIELCFRQIIYIYMYVQVIP